MKYFLDSAKLDEIKLAYNTFGIDGVTTNPRHIMLSGKPFLTAITDIANWIKEEGLEGYEKFPVSVEINPHLDDTEEMIAAAKKVSAISENFVIKDPCTEAGVAAARRLEERGHPHQRDAGVQPGTGHLARKERLPLRFSVPGLERGQR